MKQFIPTHRGRIPHTKPTTNSHAAAAYGYEHDGFGGSAQARQGVAWRHTLSELSSSSWITDASGNACTERSRSANQHLQYLPFGESRHPEQGRRVDQRTNHDIRFKFTSKERDSETGMDYFGARYYNSDISVWLSVDPLSDMYPSTSPYMYVLGNPIIFVDPNGMNHDIHITGEAAEQATEQLDASTSLNITRDENGKIHAVGEAKTDGDKLLLEAITNPDIDVQVEATNSPGPNTFGGSFLGTTITSIDADNCKDAKKVKSYQLVEPDALAYMDRVGDTEGSGKSMLHEVTESYLAAIISQGSGISAGPANINSPTYWLYLAAHNNATPQPPIYYYQRDNYVKNRALVREILETIKTYEQLMNF